MLAFLYSIENLQDVFKKYRKRYISTYYFKYYVDYLKAKDMGLNAFLAESLWTGKARDEAQEEIYRFMETWFLNDKGKDATEVDGLSFARVFNGTFTILLTTIAKYAGIFIRLYEKTQKANEEIIICYDCKDSLAYKVADLLNSSLRFSFTLVHSEAEDRRADEDRFLLYQNIIFKKQETLKRTFLCKAFRIVQRLFCLKKLSRKTMFSPGSTNSWLKKYANELNCIMHNFRRPSLSWVMLDKPQLTGKVGTAVSKSFGVMLELLKGKSVKEFKILNCDLNPVFRTHALSYLTLLRDEILKYANQAAEAIEFYQPVGIEVHYGFAEKPKILASIARMRNIQVICLLDGYGTRLFYSFEKNDTFSLSRTIFLEFSSKGKQELVRKGVQPQNIHVVTAPVFTEVLENSQTVKKANRHIDSFFDFMVFTLIPNNYSANWQWHALQQYLCDILDVCFEMGCNRIGVKFKNYSVDWPRYKDVIVRYDGKFDLKILSGKAIDYYCKAENIIGGISTAMAEAAILKKKYFIYDPLHSGYFEKGNIWQDGLPIARNKEELLINIQEENYFCSRKEEADQYGIPLNRTPEEIKMRTVRELANLFTKAKLKALA